jgi:hypothetical protein
MRYRSRVGTFSAAGTVMASARNRRSCGPTGAQRCETRRPWRTLGNSEWPSQKCSVPRLSPSRCSSAGAQAEGRQRHGSFTSGRSLHSHDRRSTGIVERVLIALDVESSRRCGPTRPSRRGDERSQRSWRRGSPCRGAMTLIQDHNGEHKLISGAGMVDGIDTHVSCAVCCCAHSAHLTWRHGGLTFRR